jgi:hypothetical protein
MYICITEVDADTGIVCTSEPMRTGPSLPNIKGFVHDWQDVSTWPVEVAPEGSYIRAPKYYGVCDDDADTNISGVLEVLTETEWNVRKQAEMEAIENLFLASKPYPSWVREGNLWVAPFPRPADARVNGGTAIYHWDEENINWKLWIPPEE